MKHSCLNAIPQVMVLFTPVAQQKVNHVKPLFFLRYTEGNTLLSLKVCIAVAPASEWSIQESYKVFLKVNPAGQKWPQEISFVETATETFNLALVRGDDVQRDFSLF